MGAWIELREVYACMHVQSSICGSCFPLTRPITDGVNCERGASVRSHARISTPIYIIIIIYIYMLDRLHVLSREG